MRKHPLIALIAFAFLATSIFIGAAGASSINLIPVRATSHLSRGESGSSAAPAYNLRWLATRVREHASAAAQLSALVARERYLPYWQGRAADLVAIHDNARPPKCLLPSAWRQLQQSNARAAAARAAAKTYAAAEAAQAAQAAEAAQGRRGSTGSTGSTSRTSCTSRTSRRGGTSGTSGTSRSGCTSSSREDPVQLQWRRSRRCLAGPEAL